MRADEQERLALRLRQEAERAARQGRAVAGRFLSAGDQPLAVQAARAAGVNVTFDGGYEGAERVQPCFYPEGEAPCFSAVWVEARWNARFAAVDHRALLGSLMALGMDRACFGELVAQEDCAWLLALPEVAAILPTDWREAGRTTLTVTLPEQPPELEAPHGQEARLTVASLRLDSVLSGALHDSRATAAERIRRGDVSVNHREELRVDRLLQPGDLLSVRGFGRVRLCEVGSPTRKDRLPVTVEIFSQKARASR